MINITLTPTYGGKPIEELNRLLGERDRWLGECYRDAVIATAITALQSIRKATAAHSPRKETVKIEGVRVKVAKRGDVHTGHTKDGRRCYRTGARCAANRRSPRIDMGPHCVQLVPPGAKAWRTADVYHVSLVDEQSKRWPKQPVEFDVVATTREAVTNYLSKRFGNIAQRQGGMAKHVLSLAMAELSTRPTKEEVGAAAKKNARRYVDIIVSRTPGNGFDIAETVTIRSNLMYALDAVMGGVGGVNDALKHAANRIAGYINSHVSKWKHIDDVVKIPFPEVKRR